MGNETTRYRILESLGKGGMGEVFLADDTQLERKVAIKFLPENLRDDPVARGRFEREAKSAAALDHPYICKIHEFTEVDGQPCIVMEHVAGQTLESRLAQGPLAPAEAIQLAAEVAEALEQAHARRILHRDLKPSNLMLTPEGHVKVMDFGLDVGALLDEKASSLPRPGGRNSSGAWALLLKTVEARALLGQADTAASLYPLVLEALDTGTVTGFLTMELLQTGAGIAAAAGGQWDAAEEHYRTALRQAEELPHKIAQPEVRRWYARMLLDRDAAGDQDRARELLGEAVGMYEQLGMPRHVEMAKEHLKML